MPVNFLKESFADEETCRDRYRIDEIRMVLGGQPTPFCFDPLSKVTQNRETRPHQQFRLYRTQQIQPDFPATPSDVLRTILLPCMTGMVKLLFVNCFVKEHGVGWPPKTVRNTPIEHPGRWLNQRVAILADPLFVVTNSTISFQVFFAS